MVGLPYTSLGCANCRKRKIKCDLNRPECNRCTSKGISCLGYDKDRNILYHRLTLQCTPNGQAKRPVRQLVRHINPLGLPPVFSMSAEVRTQLYSTFMESFFAPYKNTNGKDDSLYFLLAHFPNLAGESELFDQSVIALASVFLGKKAGDELLARRGLEIYSSALNVMTRALRQKAPPTSHMLYATIILHTYETIYGSENALQNCLVHIQGAMAIMKHHKFKIDGTQTLTKVMLTRQKWAAAFYILNSKSASISDFQCLALGQDDSPLDKLFGIIAQFAFLQRNLENVAGLHGLHRKRAFEELLRWSLQLQERLHTDWLSRATEALEGKPDPFPEDRPLPDRALLPLDAALIPYTFKTLNSAKTHILFWIASLKICQMIYELENLLHRYFNSAHMLFYAGEICRSIAYCMQPKIQRSASHAVLFAISQVSKCYIACEAIHMFTWCQGIYHYMKRQGFDVASCVSDADWALWSAARSESNNSRCTFIDSAQVDDRATIADMEDQHKSDEKTNSSSAMQELHAES